MKIKFSFSKFPVSLLIFAAVLLSTIAAVDSRRVLVKGKELKLEMDGQVFKQLILNETDQDGNVERILLDKTSLETKSWQIPPISKMAGVSDNDNHNDTATATDTKGKIEVQDGRGIISGRVAENAGGDAQDVDGRVIRTRAQYAPITTTTTTLAPITTTTTTTPPVPTTTTAATTTTTTPPPTPIPPPPQSNMKGSHQARGVSPHSHSVSTTNSTQGKTCLSHREFKDRIKQITIQAKSTISLECPDQLPCQLWGSCSHLWPTGLITAKLSIEKVFLEHYFDTLHADFELSLKKEWRTFIMGCCDYYRLFNDFEGVDDMKEGRSGSDSEPKKTPASNGDDVGNIDANGEVIGDGGNSGGPPLFTTGTRPRRKRDRSPSGDTTGLTDCRARLLDIQECVGYGVWKATCKRHKYDN